MSFAFLSDSNGTENYVSGAQNVVNIIATALNTSAINASVSGNTAGQMLARIDADVIAYGPQFCLVMAGTNEMNAAYANDTSADTMIATYIAAIEDIIDALQGDDIKPLIVSPPCSRIVEEALRWPPVLVALRNLCDRKGVPYIPFFEAMARVADDASEFLALMRADPDKHHLDAQGHAFLAETILPYVAVSVPAPAAGCVWKSNDSGTGLAFSNGDLDMKQSGSSTAGGSARGTIAKTTGKYYFEITYVTRVNPSDAKIGFDAETAYSLCTNVSTTTNKQWWYRDDGGVNTNGSPLEASGKPTWASTNATVGAAVDVDAGKIWFRASNGAWLTAANTAAVEAGNGADFTGITANLPMRPFGGIGSGAANGNILRINCGQDAYVHTPPSGFGNFE